MRRETLVEWYMDNLKAPRKTAEMLADIAKRTGGYQRMYDRAVKVLEKCEARAYEGGKA